MSPAAVGGAVVGSGKAYLLTVVEYRLEFPGRHQEKEPFELDSVNIWRY